MGQTSTDRIPSISIGKLEKQAELLFPFAPEDCARVRMKKQWKRDQWVKAKLLEHHEI